MFLRLTTTALLLALSYGGVAHAAADPVTNQASYWGTNCVKTEMNGDTTYYTAPADATKVIVKGGTGYEVYDQAPFTNLTAPINPKNGQPYGISHVIVCGGTPSQPTAGTVTPGKGGGETESEVAPASAQTGNESLPNVGTSANVLLTASLLATAAGTLAHRRITMRRLA